MTEAVVSQEAIEKILKAEMRAEIEKLKGELDRTKVELDRAKADRGQIKFGVSAKGAVSVYGLQRFPVTLYSNQWERLLAAGPEMKTFMQANADKLAVKK